MAYRGGPGGLPPALGHGVQWGARGLAPGLGHGVQMGVRGQGITLKALSCEAAHLSPQFPCLSIENFLLLTYRLNK